MFFDYNEEKEEKKWRRIKRPVFSKFWRVVHNVVAHPMLAVYRPWGQRLHEWTAEKMYHQPKSASTQNKNEKHWLFDGSIGDTD